MKIERLKLLHFNLLELLKYDPETGVFNFLEEDKRELWKHVNGMPKNICKNLIIDFVSYTFANLAVFYITGKLPTKKIIYINGDSTDHRYKNLFVDYNPREKTVRSQALSHKELLETLRYDPDTGIFYWLKKKVGRQRKNLIAGTIKTSNNTYISINSTLYTAAKLAIFYTTGKYPLNNVRKKNKNNKDNSYKNLTLLIPEQTLELEFIITIGHLAEIKKWYVKVTNVDKIIKLVKYDSEYDAIIDYKKIKNHYKGLMILNTPNKTAKGDFFNDFIYAMKLKVTLNENISSLQTHRNIIFLKLRNNLTEKQKQHIKIQIVNINEIIKYNKHEIEEINLKWINGDSTKKLIKTKLNRRKLK